MKPSIGLALVALTTALLVAREARSHEWYPSACCDHEDCVHIPEDQIEKTAEGYYLKEYDLLVPYANANSSPDNLYHGCFFGTENWGPYFRSLSSRDPTQNRTNLCFWAPEGGV